MPQRNNDSLEGRKKGSVHAFGGAWHHQRGHLKCCGCQLITDALF